MSKYNASHPSVRERFGGLEERLLEPKHPFYIQFDFAGALEEYAELCACIERKASNLMDLRDHWIYHQFLHQGLYCRVYRNHSGFFYSISFDVNKVDATFQKNLGRLFRFTRFHDITPETKLETIFETPL